MPNMNSATRDSIVTAAEKQGFRVQLKKDGKDLYDKNLVFRSPKYPSTVYVHRDTGISKSSGNMSYLKVAVHPSYFRDEAVDPSAGIEDYINNRTKLNRHASSNYVGFPMFDGNDEPCGRCFRVSSIPALEKLLKVLSSISVCDPSTCKKI